MDALTPSPERRSQPAGVMPRWVQCSRHVRGRESLRSRRARGGRFEGPALMTENGGSRPRLPIGKAGCNAAGHANRLRRRGRRPRPRLTTHAPSWPPRAGASDQGPGAACSPWPSCDQRWGRTSVSTPSGCCSTASRWIWPRARSGQITPVPELAPLLRAIAAGGGPIISVTAEEGSEPYESSRRSHWDGPSCGGTRIWR